MQNRCIQIEPGRLCGRSRGRISEQGTPRFGAVLGHLLLWPKRWSCKSGLIPVPVNAQEAVQRLPSAWATKMIDRWQGVKRFDPGSFAAAVHNRTSGVLTIGIFAIAYQGQVATTVSSIVDHNGTISVLPLTDPNCAVDLCAIGKTDTYRRSMSPPFMPGSPPITRVIGLVDKTIREDTTGVVGGKTDALELLNDGTINWKQRKENCPVSQD